ncbi:MAG: hypothetical protein AAFV19_12205 [Pseudomonadota bacterium]
MSDKNKKVEVRYGSFTCSIEGYDNPVEQLREILGLMQNMISETPQLSEQSGDFDPTNVEDALSENGDPSPGIVVIRNANAEATADTVVAEDEIAPPRDTPTGYANGAVGGPADVDNADILMVDRPTDAMDTIDADLVAELAEDDAARSADLEDTVVSDAFQADAWDTGSDLTPDAGLRAGQDVSGDTVETDVGAEADDAEEVDSAVDVDLADKAYHADQADDATETTPVDDAVVAAVSGDVVEAADLTQTSGATEDVGTEETAVVAAAEAVEETVEDEAPADEIVSEDAPASEGTLEDVAQAPDLPSWQTDMPSEPAAAVAEESHSADDVAADSTELNDSDAQDGGDQTGPDLGAAATAAVATAAAAAGSGALGSWGDRIAGYVQSDDAPGSDETETETETEDTSSAAFDEAGPSSLRDHIAAELQNATEGDDGAETAEATDVSEPDVSESFIAAQTAPETEAVAEDTADAGEIVTDAIAEQTPDAANARFGFDTSAKPWESEPLAETASADAADSTGAAPDALTPESAADEAIEDTPLAAEAPAEDAVADTLADAVADPVALEDASDEEAPAPQEPENRGGDVLNIFAAPPSARAAAPRSAPVNIFAAAPAREPAAPAEIDRTAAALRDPAEVVNIFGAPEQEAPVRDAEHVAEAEPEADAAPDLATPVETLDAPESDQPIADDFTATPAEEPAGTQPAAFAGTETADPAPERGPVPEMFANMPADIFDAPPASDAAPTPDPFDTPVAEPETAIESTEPDFALPPIGDPAEFTRNVAAETTEPAPAEPDMAEPEVVAADAVKPELVQPQAVEPEIVEPEVVEAEPLEPAAYFREAAPSQDPSGTDQPISGQVEVMPPEDEPADPAGQSGGFNIFAAPQTDRTASSLRRFADSFSSDLPPEEPSVINATAEPDLEEGPRPPWERPDGPMPDYSASARVRQGLDPFPQNDAPKPAPAEEPAGTAVGEALSQGDPNAPKTASQSRFQALLSRVNNNAEETSAPQAIEGNGDRPKLSATQIAERAEGQTTADLLAASAAWLTLISDTPQFTRREVMQVFDTIPGDHPKTLEARIKGYGKLLRAGTVQLVDDGVFAMSPPAAEKYDTLIRQG